MMMDMYRQPEMVLKALERITPLVIKQGVGMATFAGKSRRVHPPAQRG